VLAELKARRDVLQSRMDATPAPAAPLKESDLRKWAVERIGRIDRLINGRDATLEPRNLIHACVDRIEVFPHEKRGMLYLPTDAYACFAREISTRLPHGDFCRSPVPFKNMVVERSDPTRIPRFRVNRRGRSASRPSPRTAPRSRTSGGVR